MTAPAKIPRPRFKPGSYSYAFKYVRDSGALAHMSGTAAAVYLALLLAARWVDIGGGVAGGLVKKLSQTKLAEQTGRCERSVRGAIRELKTLQLLVTLKTGRGAGIAAAYMILTEKPAAGCRFFRQGTRQPVTGEPGRTAPQKRQNPTENPAASCRPSKGIKITNTTKGGCAAHGGEKTKRHAPDAKTQPIRDFIAGKTDDELADLKARAVDNVPDRHRQRFKTADPRKDPMLQLAIWDVAKAAGQLPEVAAKETTG